MMFGSKKRLLVSAAAGLTLVCLAACSSTGGAQSETPASAAGGGAGVADTPRLTFAMITHAPPGDAFWDVIQEGAKDAAAKDNIDFKYSGSIQVPEQANMIQNAIDSKVDGIAVTMPDAAALGPQIQKAVDAGIPVVMINAGEHDWQSTGALAFYGEPEVLAGEFAGTELNKLGAKHAICVIQAQGQQQLEDRCDGMAKTFSGQTDRMYAEGTDPSQYLSTVNATLQTDPSIDAIVTLGPALGVAVADAVKENGGKQIVATYAFNSDVVTALQDGRLAFTIDQQPWLQGYMAVDSLWQYNFNNSILGAQQSIPTGPLVVDKDNIGQIVPFIEANKR
jgi:simple sugar transport system substrate-binding protein